MLRQYNEGQITFKLLNEIHAKLTTKNNLRKCYTKSFPDDCHHHFQYLTDLLNTIDIYSDLNDEDLNYFDLYPKVMSLSKELFNRSKIINGLNRACEKTLIHESKIEFIVNIFLYIYFFIDYNSSKIKSFFDNKGI